MSVSGPGSERGAGSVFVLSIVMVIMVALLGVAVLAAGYVARHQAAAAADLAALAAAGQLSSGTADPCAVAERVATANSGDLRDCVVDGMEVEVQVRVRTTAALPWLPDQLRRARAGPPH